MNIHDFFTMVASIIAALIAVLLTSISNRLVRMEDKLDKKQDRDECEVRDDRYCLDSEKLWDALSTHSHEGLPAGSKVTR